MKFKFNYLESSLAYQTEAGHTWYQLTEQFTGSFGSLGFSLSEGWMTFTVQTSQIRVFYKQVKEANSSFWKSRNAVYFKKALAKESPVTFEFSEKDRIWKQGGRWVKRGTSWK